MVNENNLKPLVDNKKLVEEVRELTETSWWKEYQNSVDKSNLSSVARNKVISKSGSEYQSERGKEGYGPMPFFDDSYDNSSALIVARSQEIISELRRNYPTVVHLLNHNRKATVAFLKANGALFIDDVIHDFYVSSGSSSSWGPEVWRQYKKEINNYVDKLCKNLVDQHGRIVDREVLRLAREALADYIHSEYQRKLPTWPSWFSENSARVRIEISGSYRTDTNYYVIWSCSGRVEVKDENRGFADFHARFSGRPEVKVLILDFDKLGDIERDFRGNIKAAEDFIDRKEIEYRKQGGNLLEYWDRKYV